MRHDDGVLTRAIPSLMNDSRFKITSPSTRDYNCIAWALERNDVWVWPPLGMEQEADEYWPESAPDDENIESFIKAMHKEGFATCKNIDYELGYTKIALYAKNGLCTHACRQLSQDIWTSKMGPLNDIQHSNPQSLEGDFYGEVYCYMKRPSTKFF